MLQTRVIPILLYNGVGLVKGIKFKDDKYVGDPVNAVRIFNEKEVDEIIILDISASQKGKGPNYDFVSEVASECFMPLSYGGGIDSVDKMKRIYDCGVEKISINTAVIDSWGLIEEAAKIFGSQSVAVSIDAKKNLFGGRTVYANRGSKNTKFDVVDFAKSAESAGAGELLINSVDRDGTGKGYDTELIRLISSVVSIPTISCGGASSLEDFKEAVDAGSSAVAAGSFFVFYGKHRAVLITYPEAKELEAYVGVR